MDDWIYAEVDAWQEIYKKGEKMVYSVGIRFNDAATLRGRSTVYHYKSYNKLVPGDHVIVDSPYNDLVCVEVVTCQPHVKSSKATKWIVDIVDKEAHKWRKNAQLELEEIENKLNAIADAMKGSNWQILRSVNAEARSLYRKYEDLKAELDG